MRLVLGDEILDLGRVVIWKDDELLRIGSNGLVLVACESVIRKVQSTFAHSQK